MTALLPPERMTQIDAQWLNGNGEMAARLRAFDWEQSPLGPPSQWTHALRNAVNLILSSALPMLIAWGPDFIQIYNDALRPLAGGKHPNIFGRSIPDSWPETWAVNGPVYTRARAGESLAIQDMEMTLDRGAGLERAWFSGSFSPVRDDDGGPGGVIFVVFETTRGVKAGNALRESEERQVFLLRLSDALRAEPSADAIADRGLLMLSEHLRLDRCYIGLYRPADDRVDLPRQVGNDRVPPMPPSIRLSDFPNALQVAVEGTLVIEDFEEAEGLSDADRRNIGGLGLRALVAATLRRGEHDPLWATVAVSSEARRWTWGEITVVEEAAERIWAAMERARAETALRASEARFAQFAASSRDALWIRDAATLTMEYVSPAVEAVYGVPSERLLGGPRDWAALIVPEDRDPALRHLERTRRGEAVVHEFRVLRPADGNFRWIRNTNFPLLDETGRVQRIGGIAQDVTETKLAVEHTAVLLAELQHRVRNIMGMIRSMANRTAPGAMGVEDYRSLLEGRLLALARVQVLLTREANAGGSLKDLIESEVATQAHHRGQYALAGPDVTLAPKAVEVLTLAFHELATNALKYGALSLPEGRLRVTWTLVEKRGRPWLSLDWVEDGTPPREPSTRRGFGSELIEGRIPYELRGEGRITIARDGARCHLEFPLRDVESILQTDAPRPATIFGGTLDMSGAPDLNGRKILVVEDDYYIACDTAAALRGAGAEVLGPCPSEEAVRDLLEDETPTHAVLDLNLGGGGPLFGVAQMLKARGVPFIFLTGYDPDVIPKDFAQIVRLQKPVPFRAIVETVARI